MLVLLFFFFFFFFFNTCYGIQFDTLLQVCRVIIVSSLWWNRFDISNGAIGSVWAMPALGNDFSIYDLKQQHSRNRAPSKFYCNCHDFILHLNLYFPSSHRSSSLYVSFPLWVTEVFTWSANAETVGLTPVEDPNFVLGIFQSNCFNWS